jgi:hypothetical protein
MPRANAYLKQAMANLRAYHEMLDETGTAHSWSALYKVLTNLLGKELTNPLRKTNELKVFAHKTSKAFHAVRARWPTQETRPLISAVKNAE